MDIRLALMTGVDIPLPEYQLTLHQPSIKEISMIGESDFFTAVQTFCIQKNLMIEDERALSETTNFQLFMMIMQDKSQASKKKAVMLLLGLLFSGCQPLITPTGLALMKQDSDPSIIDSSNFEGLQQIFSQLFCLSAQEKDSFNPGNDMAKKIADKLMRGRQRVAAQKRAKDGDGSILASYLSILTVGLHSMSMSDLMELTIYQLYDLIERYSLYTNWDLDTRQRLAGGKPDSSPDDWMKIMH